MATVRESITALYAQSQKSASESEALFAVIEPEAVTFDDAANDAATDMATDMDFQIPNGYGSNGDGPHGDGPHGDGPTGDGRPSIARRFDDLRNLAERAAQDDTSAYETSPDHTPHDHTPPADAMTDAPADLTTGNIATTFGGNFGATSDSPPHMTDMNPGDMNTVDMNPVDIVPDISAPPAANDDTDADTDAAMAPTLPSEPPAPATGDALSDLGVADIQELVRQAWEDETALRGGADPRDGTVPKGVGVGESVGESVSMDNGDTDVGDANNDMTNDDPDIAAAMEEIAAAVVDSADVAATDAADATDADAPAAVDLAGMKADLVAAMRAELHAVVATDLRPIIKAAIAEALQELPAAKPAPRTRKTAAKKAATGAARKKAPARKSTPVSDAEAGTSDNTDSEIGNSGD